MYAVIETGGKQYIVSEGLILDIEKVESDKSITFDQVLMVFDDKETTVGQPTLANATVTATVLEQKRDKKIKVFKFKRKTGYQKTQGHRQSITVIKIDKINLKNVAAKKATEPAKQETKPKTETKKDSKKETAEA